MQGESAGLRRQITLLEQKAETAIKLADAEQLSRRQAEQLVQTLKSLNVSYEKSLAEYKKELASKNIEISKLKKGRIKRFFTAFAIGAIAAFTLGALVGGN